MHCHTLTASHVCHGDSWGPPWPAAPTAPHTLSQPRTQQLLCPFCFKDPPSTVCCEFPKGIKAKSTGNHRWLWEFFGTERAPGSFQSPCYLFVYQPQLGKGAFPVLPQPLPQPPPGISALPGQSIPFFLPLWKSQCHGSPREESRA